MSRRARRIALALVVLAGAMAFVSASGAFTSVTADRTMQVSVAGDADALLGLSPHSGPNGAGAYAQTTNGQLEILIDGTNTAGSGVNLNARTEIRDVFNVTNQGTQSIDVWIDKSGDNTALVTFGNATGVQMDGSSGDAQTIGTGETIEVGLVIDTRGASLSPGDTLIDSVTIHANATAT